MTLSPEELERYARHIVLAELGGPGQQRLKAARALVIGAGGLGTPVLQYLAAAGIGTIGIVDDDRVSRANLQRQVIHDTDRIGWSKTRSAASAITRINPHVQAVEHEERLTAENGERLIAGYDIVADGSDNAATRWLVAELCERLEKTLVSAAVGRFDGSLTTLKPHMRDATGVRLPRYSDIFPEPPPEGLVPACAEAGIIGALTGIVGAMQALEIIKEVAGVGDTLAGRLVLVDGKAMRFETIEYKRGDDKRGG